MLKIISSKNAKNSWNKPKKLLPQKMPKQFLTKFQKYFLKECQKHFLKVCKIILPQRISRRMFLLIIFPWKSGNKNPTSISLRRWSARASLSASSAPSPLFSFTSTRRCSSRLKRKGFEIRIKSCFIMTYCFKYLPPLPNLGGKTKMKKCPNCKKGTVVLVVILFSCPGQLNRWPCHSLTQSLNY